MKKGLLLVTLGTGLIADIALAANPFNFFADKSPIKALSTVEAGITVTSVTDDLDHPWGMAFLPDGRILVTERSGSVRYVSSNGSKSEPLAGLPKIEVGGQGGLFDLILDPGFANNHRVYFSYSEPGDGGNSTAVARATLQENALSDLKVIFRQEPKIKSSHHFGGQLVFDRDGNLFITLGDRSSQRADAQTLNTHHGKVVRIRLDGSIPADNPFVNKSDALGAIWSYGHRNVQGAALNPQTGQLWTHEHGPQGGDEINITQAGKNYGWPAITYGEEYGGGKIGETAKDGMEQPLHYWVPSIAPSGMAFYTGSLFPAWNNDLLVGSLKFGELVRLDLDDDKVVREERINIGSRIRDVRQGPDGAVYLLTDENNGQLLRLTPATAKPGK
ncbi:MAG TPA: PQQ-dependent sugar dehydrogenase [Dongiaceae bacterium]|nr:PQQ-dependent sugar dehydrogenase [Dongiaceae bacterium]